MDDHRDEKPDSGERLPRRAKIAFIVAASLCCAAALVFLIVCLTTAAGLFLVLTLLLFTVGAALFLVLIYKLKATRKRGDSEDGRNSGNPMPFVALGLDLAAVGSFFLGTAIISVGGEFAAFGLLFYFLTLVAPVLGIATAIAALCRINDKKLGKTGVAISVTAISLPIVTVIVIVVLFSSGVAVISFM